MLVTPATVGEPLNASPISDDEIAAPAAPPPVVFLHDPAWPPYAQTEITVFPDPPVAGQPTEICVWVSTPAPCRRPSRSIWLLPTSASVCPLRPSAAGPSSCHRGASVKVCLNWIPPAVGHWCLQAVLHQPDFPDQISQRNIDIWETLLPGYAGRH